MAIYWLIWLHVEPFTAERARCTHPASLQHSPCSNFSHEKSTGLTPLKYFQILASAGPILSLTLYS